MYVLSMCNVDFPDRSAGKESACHAGDPSLISWSGRSAREGIGFPLPCGIPGFDPWVGKIPWRRERLPTPVFWPGEFMDYIVHGVAKS